MDYNWNWKIFFEPSPDGSGTYLYTLIRGLYWTLGVSVAAWWLALALGVVVGVLRVGGGPWMARVCAGYVELFRNIPLLVQMFLWYFVFPEVTPAALGDAIKSMDPLWSTFWTAVVCLGLFTSARIAEQVRTGIQSIPVGLHMAATALGLTRWQAYRHVLLPIAGRITLPPLTSEALNLIKNSSIAFTIGLMEITGAARAMQEFSFQIFESFAAATVLYLLINLVVVLLMRYLEKRFSVPGYLGTAR
ncbi:amino acid ABC transporter permease [Pusillimonas sp. CC-YST705]|uniref:Amino acid ABC transporter permease n=1 Tax=Mesopusillimonas faecipullorum TaxID=2755040 RepID=A0ABS8C9A5_9BURK|nr:amino acid ABC transporter permease [Mesopusillimonas faecipullorum]MCB5362615.1 amino acid ABC transporter permease [Mesopusillimonas faecipullorum]